MRGAQSSDLPPARKARWRRRALAPLPAFALALLALLAPASVRRAFAQADSPMAAPVPGPLLDRAAALDPALRLQAVMELQAQATPAAASLLVIMLERDIDVRVRRAAALALGSAHDPALAVPLEVAAHVDPDLEVRANAARSRQAVAPFGRRVKLAAGLSVLCPGCGYFYLRRPGQALAYLGGVAALLGSGFLVVAQSPVDPDTGSRTDGRAMPLFIGAQNLWFYGVYATYRDARLARRDEGYRYPVAREDLGDLLVAPFNPHVLKRPWVWAGVPVLLGAAIGFGYLVSRGQPAGMASTMRSLGDPGGVRFFGRQYGTGTGFALGEAYNTGLFLPVGVGEEALFRGVVQAGLSETSLGLWGGWAVGSAIFGGVHVFNFIGDSGGARTAALAVPYLMVTGSYLGLAYIRTNFSLLAGAAVHFWYDFLLETLVFIADPDHQPFAMRLAVPF